MGELFKFTASQVQDIANACLIGSLVVGVISTFVVVWTGNIKEAALKREIASANAVAETAKVTAAKLNIKAAALEKEAETAKLEQERLKGLLAWRSINQEQHDKIVYALKGKKMDIWFQYTEADPEAREYAEQILSILNDAEIYVKKSNFMSWGSGKYNKGFCISPNGQGGFLRKIFLSAGVDTQLFDEFSPENLKEQIIVRIASKPKPPLKYKHAK